MHNSINLSIEPDWAPNAKAKYNASENITAKNILILNLNNPLAHGHIYSEVLSELYAVSETYPEYDCVIAFLSPRMKDSIDFFDLKLSNKIKFIKKGQEFFLNFEQLRIVNHSPRSYINKVKNVLALKKAFHLSKPIVKKSREALLYCSRNSTTAKHGRRLTQETEIEIIKILSEYAHNNNLEFHLLTGEEPDGAKTLISKQYDLFSSAKLIVGVHGGAMSNLIFLDSAKSPKIIELCPSPEKCFSRLFDGAIDTFAEYHPILYKLPPEAEKLKGRNLMAVLSEEESTIDMSEFEKKLSQI
jgi:capsular polysaccharide biosynthesis protein